MENLNLPYPIQIFVFGQDQKLGLEVASMLQVEPAGYEIKCFSDGERIPHQTETVRGRDVYIIVSSFIGDEMDKWILDCLRFVWSVKNGQPQKITVVLPKLLHQRQDVENRELRQPKMSDLFPKLLKTAGMDYMVVCKLHNPASCTTDPPMENLDTTRIIIEEIRENYDLSKIVIASADMGGSKYARKIAEELLVSLLIVDKDRNPRTGETRAMNVYSQGEISPKVDTVIFVDDIISTFGSLQKGAEALTKEFPQIVNFVAKVTHGDFSRLTLRNICDSKFLEVDVMNTVPIGQNFILEAKKFGKNLKVTSVAKLIARTIDNLHNGQSVSALWTKNGG
jgi:ribose-phosphate pyrophosphokinase